MRFRHNSCALQQKHPYFKGSLSQINKVIHQQLIDRVRFPFYSLDKTKKLKEKKEKIEEDWKQIAAHALFQKQQKKFQKKIPLSFWSQRMFGGENMNFMNVYSNFQNKSSKRKRKDKK